MTGPRSEGAESAVPPTGRLEGTTVPEILWDLSSEGFSGSLLLDRGPVRKVLFFRDGRVIFASSSSVEDRLGPFLLRRGQVGLADLLDAGGRVMRGRRLGQTLIEMGTLSQEQVLSAVLEQVRQIALSTFSWRGGRWRLSRACLPAEESITLDQPIEELILDGIRQLEDWRWIRRAVGGSRAVYRVRPGHLDTTLILGLTERSLIENLVHARCVEDLCEAVYASSYDVYRSLWALSILGLVQRMESSAAEAPPSPLVGRLRGETVIDLLLRLGERRTTGILRLFREDREGAIHLRDGRVEFATTNDPERSLLVHLLRRGVISDRDHEQVLRQLLSGKRVGRLLVDRGALEDSDLERFVREQVLDVAREILLWDDGDYEIDETPPVAESIVLGWSVEDVVMSAMEGCQDTHAVLSGVGGLDTVYRLRPDYLERLDRMQLRPAAWDVVTALREKRSLRQLLELRPEADFEICRLLDGLNRVGVVERVAQEEVFGVDERTDGEKSAVTGEPQAEPSPLPLLTGAAGEDEGESDKEFSAAALAPELFDRDGGASKASAPPVPSEMAASSPVAVQVDGRTAGEDPPSGETAEEMPTEAGNETLIVEVPITNFVQEGAGADQAPAEVIVSDERFDPDETLEIDRSQLDLTTPPVSLPELIGEDEALELTGATDERSVDAAGEPAGDEEDAGGEEADREAQPSPPDGPDPGSAAAGPLEAAGGASADSPTPALADEWSHPPDRDADELAGGEEPEDAPGAASQAAAVAAGDLSCPVDVSSLQRPAGDADDSNGIQAVGEGGAEMPAEDQAVDAGDQGDRGSSTPGESAGSEPHQAPIDVPEETWAVVDRFNARHQALFGQLKLEIGAGVRNYVRTCQRRLGAAAAAFEEIPIDAGGCFDRSRLGEALARAASRGEPIDPERLIEIELEMVRELLSRQRLSQIESLLGQV